MNSKKCSALLATLILTLGQAALADTIQTTTTTSSTQVAPSISTTQTVVSQTALPTPAAPMIMITPAGSVVESPVTVGGCPPSAAIAPAGAVSVLMPNWSDLIRRRNDLIARVTVEKNRGALCPADAQAFLDKIAAIDALRLQLPNDNSVCNWKMVKKLYKAYDRLAYALQDTTGLGDRQLAATYSVISL